MYKRQVNNLEQSTPEPEIESKLNNIPTGVSIENASYIESKEHNAQTIQEENSTSEIEMNNKDEYTPQLFLHDNESEVESELEETGRDEHTEKLFDQDLNEEEDFEIPAFLRKQKF